MSYCLKYHTGYPKLKSEKEYAIRLLENSISFTPLAYGLETVNIPKANILAIEVDGQTYRSVGRAAAGAIIGGVITGGIGTIIGAAMGGKKRNIDQLSILLTESERDYKMQFAGHETSGQIGDEILKWLSEPSVNPDSESDVERKILQSSSSIERAKIIFDSYENKLISREGMNRLKEKYL